MRSDRTSLSRICQWSDDDLTPSASATFSDEAQNAMEQIGT